MRPPVLGFVGLLALSAAMVPAAAAPKVVATFRPVHGIVAAVMAGVGDPRLLIDTPVSPHTYALTPSKRRLLEDADLIIGIGPDMEKGIWETVQSLPGDALALMPTAGDRVIGPDASAGQAGAPGESDPHIWLDTGIAADLADAVAQRLSALDPTDAETFRANAAAFRDTIAGLDADLAAALANHRAAAAISYHDAFSYFARQWRLEYGFIVREPDMAPAAGTVARLRDRAASGAVACLMTEPEFRPDLFQALAADFDLPVIEIDPVGNQLPPGPGFYPALLGAVGAAFATCYGG